MPGISLPNASSSSFSEGMDYPSSDMEPLTWPTRIHSFLSADGDDDDVDHAQCSSAITVRENTSTSSVLSLELDAQERRLFESLIQAAQALQEGRISGNYSAKQVQVRVAGGWVRDKLLGLSTHDVDIALDTCTGVEFAHIVKEFLNSHTTEHNVPGSADSDRAAACGKIGVIAANPAQSKHLETATMKIHGIEVDFSNLRHETYADDSRIPIAMIGTPTQDSFRRDFTMNALYYNLQTQQVEDWTRRGLSDLLENKLVVTPVDAYQTFRDDPLRVLRAIRFAVRFDMRLDPTLQQASMDVQIHRELQRKVSRERVGKELEGMLSGKHANPQKALEILCDLHLAGGVFCIPSDTDSSIYHGTIGQAGLELVPYHLGESTADEMAHLRQTAWEEARECLVTMKKILDNNLSSEGATSMNRERVDTRLVYLATILLPFMKLQYTEKNKAKYVVEYMIKEGIKFKNKDVQGIVSMANSLDDMGQLLQQVPEGEAAPSFRLQAGLILRDVKELWVTLLILATVRLIRRKGRDDDHFWIRRCQRCYRIITQELDLDGCWKNKPLLNGKELMKILCIDHGPQVGVYNTEQIHWMLLNPSGSLEELKIYLKDFQKKEELEQDQAAQHISKKMHL